MEGSNVVDMGRLTGFTTGRQAKSPRERTARCPRYPQEQERIRRVLVTITV
jgi:hypothetical protein